MRSFTKKCNLNVKSTSVALTQWKHSRATKWVWCQNLPSPPQRLPTQRPPRSWRASALPLNQAIKRRAEIALSSRKHSCGAVKIWREHQWLQNIKRSDAWGARWSFWRNSGATLRQTPVGAHSRLLSSQIKNGITCELFHGHFHPRSLLLGNLIGAKPGRRCRGVMGHGEAESKEHMRMTSNARGD